MGAGAAQFNHFCEEHMYNFFWSNLTHMSNSLFGRAECGWLGWLVLSLSAQLFGSPALAVQLVVSHRTPSVRRRPSSSPLSVGG